MYAVSKGDPRPKRADFVTNEDFMKSLILWCRIHGHAERIIVPRPQVDYITYEELIRRLRGED